MSEARTIAEQLSASSDNRTLESRKGNCDELALRSDEAARMQDLNNDPRTHPNQQGACSELIFKKISGFQTHTTRVFQLPFRKTKALTNARVEKAIMIARKTPRGPKPRTMARP
jgi:hypothetical protein